MRAHRPQTQIWLCAARRLMPIGVVGFVLALTTLTGVAGFIPHALATPSITIFDRIAPNQSAQDSSVDADQAQDNDLQQSSNQPSTQDPNHTQGSIDNTPDAQAQASEMGLLGHAALIMLPDKTVVFAHHAATQYAMASTTKLMTALVFLQAQVPMSTVATIDEDVASMDYATMRLATGQQLTAQKLLDAMLVISANDAALTLGRLAAQSDSAFVARMNKQAAKLGLNQTHFMNAHGLDEDGHYSTAYDLALLGLEAFREPRLHRIMLTPHLSWVDKDNKKMGRSSTNALLGTYPGNEGMKTGYTGNAGRCFVGYTKRDGLGVVTVVMGAPSPKGHFDDTTALLDWFYSQCKAQDYRKKMRGAHEVFAPAFGSGIRASLTTPENSTILRSAETFTGKSIDHEVIEVTSLHPELRVRAVTSMHVFKQYGTVMHVTLERTITPQMPYVALTFAQQAKEVRGLEFGSLAGRQSYAPLTK